MIEKLKEFKDKTIEYVKDHEDEIMGCITCSVMMFMGISIGTLAERARQYETRSIDMGTYALGAYVQGLHDGCKMEKDEDLVTVIKN